ncbi:hypothetical protein Tco_1266268 [Tanacetum coccineum]
MSNTRNETMILERPFLATIHAEIDVFNKEISLGIGGDRVTFNMNKKIHNSTTPIGEIYMINATSNTPSDASSRVEETNDMHNKNNYQEHERSCKKPRKLEFDINLPSTHFCKPNKQILEGEFWPTCDPNIKECNGGHEIYEINKDGDLKKWKVQEDNTYWWHDQKSEEEERQKLGIIIEEIDGCLADGKRKRVKIQGYDPYGSGQWKKDPPTDVVFSTKEWNPKSP